MKFDPPSVPFGSQAIILLAEDDPDDVLLMKLAFRRAGLTNPVHVVTSGEDAIEYLKGALEAKSSGWPVPLLISLDINMPFATGFEVLDWIRAQHALDEVPVVVMSQSDRGKDANRAVQLGARSYLVKPACFDGLVGMMRIFKSLVEQVEHGPIGMSTNLPLDRKGTNSGEPGVRHVRHMPIAGGRHNPAFNQQRLPRSAIG
jgi:CheY-like chemotaxis protein